LLGIDFYGDNLFATEQELKKTNAACHLLASQFARLAIRHGASAGLLAGWILVKALDGAGFDTTLCAYDTAVHRDGHGAVYLPN
jgi:hypothetical protein